MIICIGMEGGNRNGELPLEIQLWNYVLILKSGLDFNFK